MANVDYDEVGGYRAQTLTRGLLVLRTIADAGAPLTLQELFDATQVPKPTLVRLLAILTQEKCTVRLDERPTYGLGPTISAIASGITDEARPEQLARPYLEELSAAVGYTANLGVLAGHEVLHLCVVLADRPIRYDARAGTRDGVYSTGLGKVLLSALDAAALERVLGTDPLPPKTKKTITTRARLDTELRRIRRQGYAYDSEEGAVGLCCYAVPIVVTGRTVAALSVSGPAGELPAEAAKHIVPELTEVADRMSADARLAPLLVAMTPPDAY